MEHLQSLQNGQNLRSRSNFGRFLDHFDSRLGAFFGTNGQDDEVHDFFAANGQDVEVFPAFEQPK